MSWLKDKLRNWLTLDEFILNGSTLNAINLHGATPMFNNYGDDIKKLQIVLSNPALLKVISLQCDLFSLGKVYVYKNGKSIDKDPFLDMFNRPNPYQRSSQFLWDFMFWNMIGNSYIYIDSKIVSNENKMYLLEHNKMNFPNEMNKRSDKLILSDSEAQKEFSITYKYDDGKTTDLLWSRIVHIPDLTNGTGNWYKGNSRIDALYKVISNSEASLDAKNINIRYSGKFMVAGQADPENPSYEGLPLSGKEQQDIESKMNGHKTVHAIKSMIDIKRFIDDIGALKLDESYLSDYFLIGSMYGIPKDVLEAFNSGTYENQEKARGAQVSYCLQPKGNALCESLRSFFDYDKEIVIDWEHLPFMQFFARDRAETERTRSFTLLNLQRAGASLEDINKFLDTNFKELNPILMPNENSQLQGTAQQGESNTNT